MIKIKDNKGFKLNDISKIKKYLNFNFSFITYESKDVKHIDIVNLFNRMRFLSSEPFDKMIFTYGKDKRKWFENLPINTIGKDIPERFKEIFPSDTYSVYSVMRVYPSGKPNGTANPRIIGMIKDTTFYVFYLDWNGNLYKH